MFATDFVPCLVERWEKRVCVGKFAIDFGSVHDINGRQCGRVDLCAANDIYRIARECLGALEIDGGQHAGDARRCARDDDIFAVWQGAFAD